MNDRKCVIRRAMSWLLTAAMTVGMLSATGVIVSAETAPEERILQETAAGETVRESEEEKKSVRQTATAADAEKEEKAEVLDEDGFLMDGEIEESMAEADPATASDAKREKYPMLYPYFPNDSPEHLKFRVLGEYLEEGDEVWYSFITREEDDELLKDRSSAFRITWRDGR